MPDAPSLKGSLILKLIEDVNAFLDRNQAEREKLKEALSEETLIVLENGASHASWYAIHIYTELTDLLWHNEGNSDLDYLRKRGAANVQRVMDSGLYAQFDFAKRFADDNHRMSVSRAEVMHAQKMVNSIQQALRNFGSDSVEWDPENPSVMLHHCRDAEAYPEQLRWVTEGATTLILRLHNPDAPPARSERPTPDHVIFRSDYGGVLAD